MKSKIHEYNFKWNGISKKQILLSIFLLSFIFAGAQTPFTVCDSLAASAITGTGYTASCVSATDTCCVYHLLITIPPWAIINDVQYSFIYRAVAPNWLQNGSFRISYLNCSTQGETCVLPVPGECARQNQTLYSEISSCIPPQQCLSYTMDFELHFCSCSGAAVGCSSTGITASSDWKICVSGTTSPCTGINEINIGNWKYYPNPSSDKIIFESDGGGKGGKFSAPTFILYDVYGRVMMTEKFADTKFYVSTKDFSSGIYFFKIVNEEEVVFAGKILRD